MSRLLLGGATTHSSDVKEVKKEVLCAVANTSRLQTSSTCE